jgi:multiple sugar transport system permease protein
MDVATTAAEGSPPVAAPSATPRRRSRPWRQNRWRQGSWPALLWLGPSLVLIVGVVLYPAYLLVRASFSRYSITGLYRGSAGTDNYTNLAGQDALPTVLMTTLVWVVAVVAITIVLSLGLAQFLDKPFFGRRVVRWALIVPWAASLIMTARLFVWIYDYYFGILNRFLQWLHVIDGPVDWLGDDSTILPAMIAVGVFVSLPFTAYVFLAGLQSIPRDLYEAAKMDGASAWRTYRSVTLPLLRPALLVAIVLNMIYVFNSFPIIWTLNDRNPGFSHDTTITFMYKIAFKSALRDVGMSAAMSVVNVLLILVAVLFYLRTVRWREEA